MKISEIMTRDVCLVAPNQTVREAATMMSDRDVGSVLVGNDDRLVGIVTDRDIALRAVAKGQGPETRIADVMSEKVRYCFDDEEVDHVARNMADLAVRRLPVVDRDKRLVGVVSLANMTYSHDSGATEDFLDSVAKPH